MRLRPDASTERVEIRDAGAVDALFQRLRPATVIHTAYRQEDANVNVEGSENVARAAAAVGARLVHLSTDIVFDGRKGAPYVEEDPPSPVTEYGRSKAEGERRVARARESAGCGAQAPACSPGWLPAAACSRRSPAPAFPRPRLRGDSRSADALPSN